MFTPQEQDYLINKVVRVADSPDMDGHYLVRFLGRVRFLMDSEFVPLSEYCANPEAPTEEERIFIEMLYQKVVWGE